MDLNRHLTRFGRTPPEMYRHSSALEPLNPRTRYNEARLFLEVQDSQLTLAASLLNLNPTIFGETGSSRLLPGSAFGRVLSTLREELLFTFIIEADVEILDEEYLYVNRRVDAAEKPRTREPENLPLRSMETQVGVETCGGQEISGDAVADATIKLKDWEREQALRKLLAAMVELTSTRPARADQTCDRLGRPLLYKTKFLLVGPIPLRQPPPGFPPVPTEVTGALISLMDLKGSKQYITMEDVVLDRMYGMVVVYLLGGIWVPLQFSWKHPQLGRMTIVDEIELVDAMKVMHMDMIGKGENEHEFVFQAEWA